MHVMRIRLHKARRYPAALLQSEKLGANFCGMSWALVRWLEERKVGVVPSRWVLKPSPLPESGFPLKGLCYWKRKTDVWETLILGVAGIIIYIYDKLLESCRMHN